MKKIIIIVLFCFILCGCPNNNLKTSGKIKCKEVDTILTYDNNPLLIDVRTKEEYDEYHLDNAINIPYDTIENDIKKIDNINLDTPIIVYCKSGARSSKAYDALKKERYNHIYDLGSINTCNS